ncbi:patatin-like phospholipase family protein [Halanaerobaculum tunisiense]
MSLEINLSLSGGGVKGIAQLGGLKAIEEAGIEIVSVAGSSAGAIIAALYGAGYTCNNLKQVIFDQDLTYFKDDLSLVRLIRQFGLYKGDAFLNWMKEKLAAKGVRTFSDLDKEVKIIATDATYRKAKVFSQQTSPCLSVAKAVRMAMSIPIFYTPCSYQTNSYVDGGVMNNLPLQTFVSSQRPTLGLLLVDKESNQPVVIDNVLDYLTNLVEMVMTVNEVRQIELTDAYVIPIQIVDINVIDFSLSQAEKEQLYKLGYQQVREELSYFKDRHTTKTKINSAKQIPATTIEIEEYSRELIDYITKKVDVSQIDGIVTTRADDYLLAYLVAKGLRKKFSVCELDEEQNYSYNQINPDDNLVVVNLRQLSQRQTNQLTKLVTNLGAKIIAAFFFLGQGRNKKLEDIPRYTLYQS